MKLYEKYIGKNRDNFSTFEDLYKNFTIDVPEHFNFAYDVLDVLAKKEPNSLALLWLDKDNNEKRFTYKQIADLSNKTANFLSSFGIKSGDKVMLVMQRNYRFWFTLMALHRIGAIAIPAPYMLKAYDIEYRVNSAQVKAVVSTPNFGFSTEFDKVKNNCLKFMYGGRPVSGWIDFDEGVRTESHIYKRPAPYNNNTDTMFIAFSSGTTGNAKMVEQDYTYPMGHIFTGCFWHHCHEGKLHFTVSDTGWAKSLWGKMYGQWLAGSPIFTYDFEKFNAKDILEKIEKYKITTFCAPPTMYRFMVQEDLTKYDLSHLKHCTTAGEALNPEVFYAWERGTGRKVYEGFGQTETTLVCQTLYPWMNPRLGSMGLPAPGYEVVILTSEGNLAPTGVTGEICISCKKGKPYGMFKGYYNSPEQNKEVFVDGYYHTGDTAYCDESGFLYYVGRIDDVIKSSGYRIGPFEVESALMEHGAVVECAVTSVPDSIRGAMVKATIVLANGYQPSNELKKELQAYVKSVTAPYKYPRVLEFIDELPKTISGKIRRNVIRERDLKKHNIQYGRKPS